MPEPLLPDRAGGEGFEGRSDRKDEYPISLNGSLDITEEDQVLALTAIVRTESV